MSTAIPELIAQELMTRLGNISTAGGYALTVTDVTRMNRDASEWTPRHLSVVVVQGDEARNEAHDRPGNPPAMAYELPFRIIGFVRQSDRTTATRDQSLMNALVAAIKKAVGNGSTEWYTFDDNAYDADWGGNENIYSTDHAGAILELSVRYRISEIDPFTLRN